jgi:hypothetical protein
MKTKWELLRERIKDAIAEDEKQLAELEAWKAIGYYEGLATIEAYRIVLRNMNALDEEEVKFSKHHDLINQIQKVVEENR